MAGTGAAALLSDVLRGGEDPYKSRVSPIVVEELQQTVRDFHPDAIIISRLELAGYVQALRATGVPLILDLDEVYAPWSRSIQSVLPSPGHAVVMRHFTRAVAAFEARVIEEVDHVWLSSDNEAQLLSENHRTTTPTSVVPNCIDVTQYIHESPPRDHHALIYTGTFGYPPNVDAARFLLEDLMPLLPDKRLRFVGSAMPDWLRDIDMPRVESVGAVENVLPYLATAGAAVIPLRAGGGTRLKALEALASGLPIISTAFGVTGLDLVPDVHYLEADSGPQFAAAIYRLAADSDLRNSLTLQGLHSVTSRHSIESLAIHLGDLLADISPGAPAAFPAPPADHLAT
jgi:glycosyltransferase involved in cell wall biosynthesis